VLKTRKPFFRKQETPILGHCARRCIPRKRQTIFSENKKPRFWDIVRAILAHLGDMVSFLKTTVLIFSHHVWSHKFVAKRAKKFT